jgi:hypothetical protein
VEGVNAESEEKHNFPLHEDVKILFSLYVLGSEIFHEMFEALER